MNIPEIRKDFPILSRKVNGRTLAYLDNAATSQKPKQVIAAVADYYKNHNANVHRGIHTLSVEATEMMESARKKIAKFVGVDDPSEIIFVRNATEAINLVAYSWGRLNIAKGDEIVLTVAEHHSNFVVWQQLAIENGAVLKIVPIRPIRLTQGKQAQVFDSEVPQTRGGRRPIDEDGEIDEIAFRKAITKRTKLVTFFHVSNVLGTINDVRRLSLVVRRLAPKAKILIDGAQAVPHMPVDISKLGCDFYVFTGHKMLGPMGIGVLWARRELLEEMPPFLYGGEMISKVSMRDSTWNELPWKFEAGTPNIAGAIGLGAAVDYLNKIGMNNVRQHEIELVDYALKQLSKIPEVTIYGPRDARKRGGVIAFNIGSSRLAPLSGASSNNNNFNLRANGVSREVSIHAHDVASILDEDGIAIRSGHHCAQPLMEFLGISSAARASFYIYNTKEEIDRLVEGIEKVKKTFKLRTDGKFSTLRSDSGQASSNNTSTKLSTGILRASVASREVSA